MPDWTTTLTLARGLEDVEESTSYGTPALKVKGKLMVRKLDDDARGERIVARVESLDERAAMLATAPATFEVTPHYQNYPWVVVHLRAIDRGLLKEVLAEAWRVVTATKPKPNAKVRAKTATPSTSKPSAKPKARPTSPTVKPKAKARTKKTKARR